MAKSIDDSLKDLRDRALETLSSDASTPAVKALKAKLETLSSVLFLEWLLGDNRFDSPTQQTEYWLSRFYDEVYTDEQPDASRIYGRFGIAIARASYLARMMRAQRMGLWRKQARAELKTQLQRQKARAEEVLKGDKGSLQEFDVSLSLGAEDEMRVLYDRAAAFVPERERPRPPKPRGGFGNSRWWGVPADTLLLLLKNLD